MDCKEESISKSYNYKNALVGKDPLRGRLNKKSTLNAHESNVNYISDVVVELIEVCLHSICFIRDLYPSNMFVRREKYGGVAMMCVHEKLCSYISSIVDGIKSLLIAQSAKSVEIAICQDWDGVAEEAFVFSFIYAKKPHTIPMDSILIKDFCQIMATLSVTQEPPRGSINEGERNESDSINRTFCVDVHIEEPIDVAVNENQERIPSEGFSEYKQGKEICSTIKRGSEEAFPWRTSSVRLRRVASPVLRALGSCEMGLMRVEVHQELKRKINDAV